MAPGHRCCAVADRMVGDTTATDASNVSALGNTAGVVCYKNIYSVQPLQSQLRYLLQRKSIQYLHAHACARTHTRAHAHTRTHAHARVHTHTHTKLFATYFNLVF